MANSKVSLKNRKIRINVEESVIDAFGALCEKDGLSMSTYGRKLILTELMARGVLPNETLLRLVMD